MLSATATLEQVEVFFQSLLLLVTATNALVTIRILRQTAVFGRIPTSPTSLRVVGGRSGVWSGSGQSGTMRLCVWRLCRPPTVLICTERRRYLIPVSTMTMQSLPCNLSWCSDGVCEHCVTCQVRLTNFVPRKTLVPHQEGSR